jgi:hypothetical protein
MPYIPLEDTKKELMTYLEKIIQSDRFNFTDLGLEAISDSFKETHCKQLKKALDDLENEGKLIKTQSRIFVYIPTDLKKHKNLAPFKVGNSFRFIVNLYFIGIVMLILSFFIVPSFQEWIISTFEFKNSKYIIPNSILLGLIFPLSLGIIIYIAYKKLFEFFLKMKLPQTIILVVILSFIVSLIAYIVFCVILNQQISSEGVTNSFAAGAGIALLAITLVTQKKDGKI